MKIAHISDLHLRSVGTRERRVLELLAEEQPDVIVITGDTVDDGKGTAVRGFLSRLRAPLGVFAVLGNWEHWRPVEPDLRAPFRVAPVQLLVNDARKLRDDLWLLGLDDSTGGFPDRTEALHAVPKGAFTIVAMHSPGFVTELRQDADLVLAGHTHGGQVRVPGLGALWLPPGSGPYEAGWYREGRARMFVSRGIGTSLLPVRLFCRPELAIVTVTR